MHELLYMVYLYINIGLCINLLHISEKHWYVVSITTEFITNILAMVIYYKIFQPYIDGQCIVVITDYKPLIYLQKQQILYKQYKWRL